MTAFSPKRVSQAGGGLWPFLGVGESVRPPPGRTQTRPECRPAPGCPAWPTWPNLPSTHPATDAASGWPLQQRDVTPALWDQGAGDVPLCPGESQNTCGLISVPHLASLGLLPRGHTSHGPRQPSWLAVPSFTPWEILCGVFRPHGIRRPWRGLGVPFLALQGHLPSCLLAGSLGAGRVQALALCACLGSAWS